MVGRLRSDKVGSVGGGMRLLPNSEPTATSGGIRLFTDEVQIS